MQIVLQPIEDFRKHNKHVETFADPTCAVSTSESDLATEMVETPTTPKAGRKRQMHLEESIRSSYNEGGSQHDKITKRILYFICKDKRPFDVIKGDGFVKLINHLCPSYKIPSVDTLKTRLDEFYDIKILEVIDLFEKVASLCLTCDIWTETTQSYLGITAHYMEQKELTSRTLTTRALDQRHTGEYIAETLNDVCNKFHISKSKISCVVTDSGANMVAAVTIFVGKSKHLPCFAHTLNLVVDSVTKINEFSSLCEKIRTIVKFFKSSVVYSDQLRSKQNISPPLKLILDVRTRWNSIFYMLQRYIDLAPIVHQILALNSKAPATPTGLELEALNNILCVLMPFEIATRELCAEKYITVSKVIPIVKTLKAQMSVESDNCELTKTVREVLKTQLLHRFKSIEDNHILAISCLLDPRFKNIAFSDRCAYARCLTRLREMQSDYNSINFNSDIVLQPNSPDSGSDFWNHIKLLASDRKQITTGSNTENISTYISRPNSSMDSDPLAFWDNMKTEFPFLYKTALQYLNIPATSVPSERLFSKAGATMTKTRNRLTCKRLDKLLFLSDCTEEEWEIGKK